ncbi:uncharacterized protein LOC122366337 [Amphibalanus amphitrite]|uniref:uncharacterized protein LOC122366337 n=1 Tax=Amphibalanus amphitrite TaxID=1232801 RepID=UPI001C90CF95|nr:uncharacterized protein LOC122366337 [Amphibalanus amphitrite]
MRRRQHAMSARRGLPALLLAAAVGAAAVGASSSVGASQQKQELPHAAAHKQIVYRYIPIDKSFLNLDRAYDDYYRTSPASESARRDYSQTGHRGRLDSYDRLYNNDYRTRNDYSDYGSATGSRGSAEADTYSSYSRADSHHHGGEVDTYSSYSRGDSHQHGLTNTYNRDSDDYGDYYDYDYSHEHTTKRPKRRRKKKTKTSKSMSSRVLDFAEAMIRRIWSRDSSGGGHGHGYKSRPKKKKKKRTRSKFKWPRFVTFDGVLRFLTYLFAVASVIGYILLVTLNAVASDGWNGFFKRRSLDTSGADLVNAEALRLLQLLDTAIERYRGRECVFCRQGWGAQTDFE